MRAISERDLAAVIPLLAAKIRDLTLELRASESRGGESSDEAVEDRMRIQEMLEQYDGILDSLRKEYEEGVKEGIQLPTFTTLVRSFQLSNKGEVAN